MRYLALDFGQKRTGVACGDDLTRIVTPIEVIWTNDAQQRLARIETLACEEMRAEALVVGLPLNMDGSRGPAAKKAEAFGHSLGERLGLPVHLVDERQTSQAANAKMSQTGLTHRQKKSRRDALAAVEILERFLAG